jgi:hypothetical protein
MGGRIMSVFYITPFSEAKNYGAELNRVIAQIENPDEWVCIRDMDTLFLTANAGNIIADYVKKYPDTGVFSCLTNRVGYRGQCFRGEISYETDILKHYKIAAKLETGQRKIIEESHNISGLLMVIQKKTWTRIGGAIENGILGVDRQILKRVAALGMPIRIMTDLYLFHFYRLNKKRKNIDHLI